MDIADQIRNWQRDCPLRQWRENRRPKITRAVAAQLFGVSQPTVQGWESGASSPSEDSWERLEERIPGIREKYKMWLSAGPQEGGLLGKAYEGRETSREPECDHCPHQESVTIAKPQHPNSKCETKKGDHYVAWRCCHCGSHWDKKPNHKPTKLQAIG